MTLAGAATATTPTALHSSTARRMAKTVYNGFHSYFADFQNLTLGAKARFEKAHWHAVQTANQDRIELYKSKVRMTAELLRSVTNRDITELALWRLAKGIYTQLVAGAPNFEIAETFFNSVFAAINDHDKIDDALIYVFSSQHQLAGGEYPIYSRYENHTAPVDLFRRMLLDAEFSVPWEDLERDACRIATAFAEEAAPEINGRFHELKFDLLEAVFYRGKAAYLVGRILDGYRTLPLVLAVLNNECGGLLIDAAIFNRAEMSVIFSFTRAHFMVDAAVPHQYLQFLKQLLPNKGDYEIYTSLGLTKHAKTEFYREFVQHLQRSHDRFVTAPGIKGMVMTVFTLPSYDIVFKVIRDRFDYPKEVTHDIVRDKYRLVSRHDRIGRMADTQEFHNLVFPLPRFAPELLDELRAMVPSQLHIDGDRLIIRHLYTERRMTPLNLFLKDASPADTRSAIDEYGNAIRQLAAANIFPGDMLLKNFGITRHGRVVFYDYDEICYLTDCNFRRLPQPRSEEEALSASPWYTVGPNDIFPEEFRLFFSGNPGARQAFEELHGDIYTPEFWWGIQEEIRAGKIVDVFPYRRARRFAERFHAD